MKPKTIFLTLTGISHFLFFGCSLPLAQKNPPLGISYPPHWESNTTSIESNLSESGWADTLGGIPLKKLIEQAWINNPDLQVSAERLIAKGEQATILGAQLLPSARAEVTGSRSKRNLIGFNLPNGSTSFTSNSFTSGLNISWELDLWGKLADKRDSALRAFEADSLEYRSSRLSLAGQTAKAWYDLIEGTQQLDLARKSAQSFIQNQTFVEERFEKGLANGLDKNLAQAISATAQAQSLALAGQLESDTRRLNFLLGKYPSSTLDQNLSKEIGEFPNPQIFISTPSQTLIKRPDLLAAEKKALSAGLDLRVARKNFFPSLALTGGPGSRSDEFENLLDQNFQTWGINGSFTQPIFNGGRLRAAHRQAKAIQAAAWGQYRSTALRAFVEVENLLAAEIRLAGQEKLIELAAQSSEQAAELSWERYQRGVEGIFNALENQRRAFDARSRAFTIRKQRLHNRIDLYLALGLSPMAEKS